MKRILPAVPFNPMSLVGAVIATINVSLITVVMIFTKHAGPYADIVVYFLLPLIAFGGLTLVYASAGYKAYEYSESTRFCEPSRDISRSATYYGVTPGRYAVELLEF